MTNKGNGIIKREIEWSKYLKLSSAGLEES